MGTYILPVLGLLFLFLAASLLRADRSKSTVLFSCGLICSFPALALYDPSDAHTFDRVIHVVGVGFLASNITLCMAYLFHWSFARTLNQRPSRWERAALAATAACVMCFVAYWCAVSATTGIAVPEALYDLRYLDRAPVMGLYLSLGLSVFACAALNVATYLRIRSGAEDPSERVLAIAAVVFFAHSSLIGIGVIVAALLVRAGGDLGALSGLKAPLILVGPIGSIAINLWVTELAPRWRAHQKVRDAQHGQAQERMRHQTARALVSACILADACLVRVRPFADPLLVEAVEARCREQAVQGYWHRVALEAARWITVERARELKSSPGNADRQTLDQVDLHVAEDAARRTVNEAYFYRDVFTVVALALDPDAAQEQSDSQRAAAMLIGDALRERTSGLGGEGGRRLLAAPSLWVHQADEPPIAQPDRVIVNADVMLSDRLLPVRTAADIGIVRAVAARSINPTQPPYRRKVAMEAARWVTALDAPSAGERLLGFADPLQGVGEDDMGADDREPIATGSFFYDVFRVAALVLGPDRLPDLPPLPRGRSWHRQDAAIIARVLRERAAQPGRARPPLASIPA